MLGNRFEIYIWITRPDQDESTENPADSEKKEEEEEAIAAAEEENTDEECLETFSVRASIANRSSANSYKDNICISRGFRPNYKGTKSKNYNNQSEQTSSAESLDSTVIQTGRYYLLFAALQL